ncbi:hypothetical protein NPIL_398621 [Nephila pilipes]|uniref:Uncharacterized protein n=1 Tax=Nephila pilipes TaxID=299642 RepID=A0A8X6MN58_NEPPI|nr:hypothetical protein NPIL_398621 [Nephila pilipes]
MCLVLFLDGMKGDLVRMAWMPIQILNDLFEKNPTLLEQMLYPVRPCSLKRSSSLDWPQDLISVSVLRLSTQSGSQQFPLWHAWWANTTETFSFQQPQKEIICILAQKQQDLKEAAGQNEMCLCCFL